MAPATWQHPLVFASSHSGQMLPHDLLQLSRLTPDRLRRSEDAYVDELYMSCLQLGAPMIRALVSRAYIDLNREPYELDPRMFSSALPGYVNSSTPRVLSGLGTIPRIVAEGEDIYRSKLEIAAALHRIETIYRPFHRNLAALVKESHTATGIAILLDCHSMPDSAIVNHQRNGSGGVDVVIGDRFGSSAAAHLVEELEALMVATGLRVRRNRPYAGGFITETYGNPAGNVHAVQIEINRSLYMNENTLEKRETFGQLEQAIAGILSEFASYVGYTMKQSNGRVAAE